MAEINIFLMLLVILATCTYTSVDHSNIKDT